MAAVELCFDLGERDLLITRSLVPWQRQDPVEIGPDDLILARRRGQHPHTLGLSARLLAHLFRQVGLVDLLQRLDRLLLARIDLAELGLDGAKLLAQIELALVLLDLDLGLLLDILHDAGPRDFALEAGQDEAQTLSDIEALEDLVLVRDPEVHIG